LETHGGKGDRQGNDLLFKEGKEDKQEPGAYQ